MKKFKIEITEILSKTFDIEANSEEEALEKVEILYKQEKIILDSNNFVDKEIKMVNNE